MRPIDGDALSALLFKRMGEYETLANDLPKNSYEGCVYYGKVTALYEAQLAIDRIIPTLDCEPVVHGEWEPGQAKCPVCGKNKFDGLDADIWADWQPHYCPNCGAKMDGGKKDENT